MKTWDWFIVSHCKGSSYLTMICCGGFQPRFSGACEASDALHTFWRRVDRSVCKVWPASWKIESIYSDYTHLSFNGSYKSFYLCFFMILMIIEQEVCIINRKNIMGNRLNIAASRKTITVLSSIKGVHFLYYRHLKYLHSRLSAKQLQTQLMEIDP